MDVIFLIYISKSFDSFGRRTSYNLYVNVLSENDSILGIIQDILSVCVRDCMGGRFTTHSIETSNHLWQEDLMFMWLVCCKSVYLIMGGLKDHLGVPREGVWAVSLYLT